VNLYLEIKSSMYEAPVTRVIGPFKSINRLSAIELETDLGLLAATEQTIYYDRTCFDSWKVLAEHPGSECEPYDHQKAMPRVAAFHHKENRTTLEILHELVNRQLLAYSQHFSSLRAC
jgi:hypothetical protein